MQRDNYIDFHAVAERHEAIHARLQNWARSIHGWPLPKTAPGFDSYQSPPGVRRDTDVHVPVKKAEAQETGQWVVALPEPQRKAVQWSYVVKSSVRAGCRYTGVKTAAALHGLIIAALDVLREKDVVH